MQDQARVVVIGGGRCWCVYFVPFNQTWLERCHVAGAV
jgi:hypothetical protein